MIFLMFRLLVPEFVSVPANMLLTNPSSFEVDPQLNADFLNSELTLI